jgi:hypothetical protein
MNHTLVCRSENHRENAAGRKYVKAYKRVVDHATDALRFISATDVPPAPPCCEIYLNSRLKIIVYADELTADGFTPRHGARYISTLPFVKRYFLYGLTEMTSPMYFIRLDDILLVARCQTP